MDLSIGPLIASCLVSMVGMGLFMFGKKAVRYPQLSVGMVLMVAPYFTGGVGATLGVAGLLLGGMLVALRSGY